MTSTDIKHVKKARKKYVCEWCGELIEINTPYCNWFTYEENVTCRMHPECVTAMHKADLYDGELPPRSTYRRGCWCGEREEYCECFKEKT